MKYLFSTIFLLCLANPAFSQPTTTSAPAPATGGKPLAVLCSVYPVYLFTKAVAAGTPLKVELMLPANLGCPHDYSLTPQDMQKIVSADVLVVNGLGLEEFLGEPVRKANPGVRIIDASAGIKNLIPFKAEEGEEHHHGEVNPHVFASPRMAALMVQRIAEELGKLDPGHASQYAANAAEFALRMNALADEFTAGVKAFPNRKIVTEHAVFDYLARDCGLEIVAVVEETPGQEPSASQMLSIVRTIRESGAAAVFTEPQYPAAVADTIAREARVPTASLDPVAGGPGDAPVDYYEQVMRSNLRTLEKLLGGGGK